MAQVAAMPDTFASGRYSKRKRTQITYAMSELDVSDSESDFETAISTPSKRTKISSTSTSTSNTRPLPKRHIFPFLALPAELRNKIYTYALSPSSAIPLVGTFKAARRTVERVSLPAQDSILANPNHWTPNRLNDNIRAEHPTPDTLVPALLALNRQVYSEAVGVLYGNEFVCTDTFALYSLLVNLGLNGVARLRRIRVLGFGYGRAMKAYNHACFALLAGATGLESLVVDAQIGWARSAKSAAGTIYRDAFPWLEAVGVGKGRADAGVEILKVLPKWLGNDMRWGMVASQGVEMEMSHGRKERWEAAVQEEMGKFKEELRKLVEKRQREVMAGPKGKKGGNKGARKGDREQ